MSSEETEKSTECPEGGLVELPIVFWTGALPGAVAQCERAGLAELDMVLGGADKVYFELQGDDVHISRWEHPARVTAPLNALRDAAVRQSESVRLQLREAIPSLAEGSSNVANWMRVGPELWFGSNWSG